MRHIYFFILLLCSFIYIGCVSKQKGGTAGFDDINKYKNYVSEISKGIISTKSGCGVIVMNTTIETWENGEELNGDLLRVSPKIEGKVVALDNRTIAFVPEQGFNQDTEYQFVLSLKDIIKDLPDELNTLSFGVKTLKQEFNIYTDALQSLL